MIEQGSHPPHARAILDPDPDRPDVYTGTWEDRAVVVEIVGPWATIHVDATPEEAPSGAPVCFVPRVEPCTPARFVGRAWIAGQRVRIVLAVVRTRGCPPVVAAAWEPLSPEMEALSDLAHDTVLAGAPETRALAERMDDALVGAPKSTRRAAGL